LFKDIFLHNSGKTAVPDIGYITHYWVATGFL
jgi:hypothetical protein